MNFSIKQKKGSAIIYALIISAFAGALILIASANVLIGSITTTQTINGIQAHYASESVTELAYHTKRLLNIQSTPGANTAHTDMMYRTDPAIDGSSNISDNFNSPGFNGYESLVFSLINAEHTRPKTNLTDITMDFKIHPDTELLENDIITNLSANRGHVIFANGYYGSSQHNINALIGDANQALLPLIIPILDPGQ